MYIRKVAPLPSGEGSFKVTSFTSSTYRPVGMSKDRTTLYSTTTALTTTLLQSVNEGSSWTTVKSGFTNEITSIMELDDGEAILYINNFGGGLVYRSTGWSTSHTTATWALVLTPTGGRMVGYGLNSATFGDEAIVTGTGKYGVLGMYGGQTGTSGDQTTMGRYVYWTENYGATWSLILDLYIWSANGGGAGGMHIHGAAYDPYWDRIWVVYGDRVVNNKSDVVYSDDHGVTWTQLDVPAEWINYKDFQSTTVLPLNDYILFGSDPTQGLWMIPRLRYRVMGRARFVFMTSGGTSNTAIATNTTSLRGTPRGPIIHAFSSERTTTQPGLAISMNRQDFQTIFTYPFSSPSSSIQPVGPTLKGTMMVGGSDSLSVKYFILGEIVAPEPGSIVYRLSATGDGLTTVFNVPHYQGRILAGYETFAQSSAALAANTVTSDATNVTITFSAAPANTVVVQIAVRVRP